MLNKPIPNPLFSIRAIAVTALDRFDADPNCDRVGPILNKLLEQAGRKQRVTDLVYGCLRNHLAIDAVIGKFAQIAPERISPKLLNIIRIAVYELVYSPKTGQHAIVCEAVEYVKAAAGARHAGFVNAILRQITNHIKNRQAILQDGDTKKILPQTPTAGCEFDTPLLPDAEASPADYFSAAFSLPKWLVKGWLSDFGLEQTRGISFASNRRPDICIRPNVLKITPQKLLEKLLRRSVDAEIVDDYMIRLKGPGAITELPGFEEGLFTVQDPTADLPVRLLNPGPDWKILDLCAAPGTKTTQLGEITGDKAQIFATDIDPARLTKVEENIIRLGIKSVTIVAYENVEKITAEAGPFDCIFLDVPCSNTGVLAKRPEVRLRITQKAIEKLAKVQHELLERAAKIIKPQGKICYSTCSIQKEEDADLIKNFLQQNPALTLQSENLTLPSQDHDGGYTAIIENQPKH
jgi:16S rRNA (cytosine967-C5)-methyltransferase